MNRIGLCFAVLFCALAAAQFRLDALADERQDSFEDGWEAKPFARLLAGRMPSINENSLVVLSDDGRFLSVWMLRPEIRIWDVGQRRWAASLQGNYAGVALFGKPCLGVSREFLQSGAVDPIIFRCGDGSVVRSIPIRKEGSTLFSTKSFVFDACHTAIAGNFVNPIAIDILTGEPDRDAARLLPRFVHALGVSGDPKRCVLYAAQNPAKTPVPSPDASVSHEPSIIYEIDLKKKTRRDVVSLGSIGNLDPPLFDGGFEVSPSGKLAVVSTRRAEPMYRSHFWLGSRLELIDLVSGRRVREFLPPAIDTLDPQRFRFAWIDDRHVIYIPLRGGPFLVDIETGQQVELKLPKSDTFRGPRDIAVAHETGLLAIAGEAEIYLYNFNEKRR